MEKYQLEMQNLVASYSKKEFTIFAAGQGTGKSRYRELMNIPFVEVLDDHPDYPNHKRVDTNWIVTRWVEEQDISQWKFDVNVAGHYSRYIITPELLTIMMLKFS